MFTLANRVDDVKLETCASPSGQMVSAQANTAPQASLQSLGWGLSPTRFSFLTFSRMVPCPVLCAICAGQCSLFLSVLFPLSAISRPSRGVSLLTRSLRQGCQVRVPSHRPLLGFLSLQGRGLEDVNPGSPASEYCWWCGEASGFLRLWKDRLLLEGWLRATGRPSDPGDPSSLLAFFLELERDPARPGLLCTGEGFPGWAFSLKWCDGSCFRGFTVKSPSFPVSCVPLCVEEDGFSFLSESVAVLGSG